MPHAGRVLFGTTHNRLRSPVQCSPESGSIQAGHMIGWRRQYGSCRFV